MKYMALGRAKLSHETGQTLADYSLVITVAAVGVTLAAFLVFRTSLGGAYDSVRAFAACLTGAC